MKKICYICLFLAGSLLIACQGYNGGDISRQLSVALEQNDSQELKTALDQAGNEFQRLVKENPDEAQEVFEEIQQFIISHKQEIVPLINNDKSLALVIGSFTNISADQAIELVQKFSSTVKETTDSLKEN